MPFVPARADATLMKRTARNPRAHPARWMRTLLAVLLVSAVHGTEALGQTLGPKDRGKYAPTDTGRVKIGSEAPDFTLESLAGPAVTLSAFRGRQRVILVFYRGHW